MDSRLEKQKLLFKGYFLGIGLKHSLNAMHIALETHCGSRKDGTPEVSHQFSIVGMLLQTFEKRLSIEELDILISSAFLHDVVEDYPEKYSINDIKNNFNDIIAETVMLLTKKDNMSEIETVFYFTNIKNSLYACVVKCFDRLHNLQTMKGGFSEEKIKEYVRETEMYFFPLISSAKNTYIDFYMIFVSLKQQMELIIKLVK